MLVLFGVGRQAIDHATAPYLQKSGYRL
eukprot:SAG31_NODE_7499_length_1670_cov_4.351369_3_plen_27_part_01